MKGALERGCPDWEGARESLCGNAAMIQQLLDNKHYNELGPLAQELKAQMQLVKSIQADRCGFVINPLTMKTCAAKCDMAVETVAFTFFFFAIKRQFPDSCTNLPYTRKAVKELRAELAKTGVTLTKEMNQMLADYDAGEYLPAAVAERTRKALLAEKVAKTPDLDGEEMVMEDVMADVARQLENPAAAPGATVVLGASGAKLSIADRLRAAKRARLA
jgi:hypothetical protein